MEFNVGMPVLLPDGVPSLIGAYEFCWWLFADSSGNTDYHCVCRNIVNYNRVGSNDGIVSDSHGAKDFSACSNDNVITQYRDIVVAASAADGYPLADIAVLTDDSTVVYHDAQPVPLKHGVPADQGGIWHYGAEAEPHEVENHFGQQRNFPLMEGIRTFI